MARPTYAEEFQNIRDGVNKVIVPNDPEAWMQSQCGESFSGGSPLPGKNSPKRPGRRKTIGSASKTMEVDKAIGDLTFKQYPTVRFKETNFEEEQKQKVSK